MTYKVLKSVDLTVSRGDKIALIGVNGAGKTTLLKILADEIPHDGGSYEFGHNTKVGYYAQHHTELLDPKEDGLRRSRFLRERCKPDKNSLRIGRDALR